MRRRAIRSVLGAVLLGLLGCRAPSLEPAPAPGGPLSIQVREVPAETVLARSYVGPYSGAEAEFEAFAGHLLESGIVPTGDLMGLFLDDPGSVPSDRTRYEIRIPVASGTRAESPYRVVEIRTSRAAVVRLTGPYAEIARRYEEVYRWTAENGWRPAGPLTEVYLVHAGSNVPQEQFVTEVRVPVEPVE